MEITEQQQLMGFPRTSPENHRPRLLHSWGSSLVSVAHKIYWKAAEPNNRIGTLVRILAWMASPFLNPIQCRWLATLSFIDACIITVEDIAVFIFPWTGQIFYKVDELALFGQSLPQKLDDAMDYVLPLLLSKKDIVLPVLHQLPMFDTVMNYMFSEQWSSSNERDIMVDTNYENSEIKETPEKDELDGETKDKEMEEIGKHFHDKEWNDRSKDDDKKDVEDTCKEILGAPEKIGMSPEKAVDKKNDEKRRSEEKVDSEVAKNDAILDLFDEGWQLKPAGKKAEDVEEQAEDETEMDENQEILAEDVDDVEKQAEHFMDDYAHRTSKCRNISHISPVW